MSGDTDSSPTEAQAAPFADPFADPSLRGPGLWRILRETFGRTRRLLDAVQVEVTSHCSGRCSYCPHTTQKQQWKARHMDPATYVRLWPLFRETTRVHLQGWGEPLLHPRFFDMAALARRADCLVSTTTCGLHMEEETAEKLVGSGLDIIAFSLTGATKSGNNAWRAGVDFDRVLDSIRLLQRVRGKKTGVHLELHFAYLMLASRVREVELLPELMADLGMHAAVISTLDYLPASGPASALHAGPEAPADSGQAVAVISEPPHALSAVPVLSPHPDLAAEAFAPHEREKTAEAEAVLAKAAAKARALGMVLHYALPSPEPSSFCLEGIARSAYVDAEGNLSPCIYLNLPTFGRDPLRRVFGSCRTEDPVSIWQSAPFAAFREKLSSGEPEPPCRACPKRFARRRRS